MKSPFEWLRHFHWMFDPAAFGWAADVATILGGLGTVVAALIALAALRQAKKLNRESSQPYVAPFIENNEHLPHMLDVGVRNHGNTTARNVRITFTPKPQISRWGSAKEVEELNFPEELRTLVPGQEWRTIWDDGAERAKDRNLPSHHDVMISYEGLDGEVLNEHFVLDWGPLYTRTFLETRTSHHMAKDINKIQKTLHGMQRSLQKLPGQAATDATTRCPAQRPEDAG
ncbi:hypothetical protein ACFWQJ_13135 [Kocuria palustris]|uniref:hypothetical protein n=1 Tax=Kocuria palustris TaxID=71999 RepID=UPI00364AF3BE